MTARRAAALAAATLVLATSSHPARAQFSFVTVAGTGAIGSRDGQANAATFALPFATAVGSTGRIYVADAGTQQIRTIDGGIVTTFAGAGGPLRGAPQWPVAGGFLDGPVATAKFSRPSGLALLRDGTLLVADSENHCIRAVSEGLVRTYAGLCGVRSTPHDGPRGAARFGYVRALAVDAAGVVFVADLDGGLRRLASDGSVTTIPLPAGAKTTIGGVSVWGSGAVEQIYASDRESLIRIDATSLSGSRFMTDAEGRRFGIPDALAALGAREVAFTDSVYNTVRIFRDETPTGGAPGSTTLQSNFTSDGEFRGAGDRDGPDGVARVSSPRGITAGPSGALYISDTGNRRIKIVRHFDARIPFEAGDPAPHVARDTTAIVGGSSLFFDTVWQRSIPGRLEALGGRPVVAFRYRDASPAALAASLGRALTSGAGTVIVQTTTADAEPGAEASAVALAEAARSAARRRVRFVVVAVPAGAEIDTFEGSAIASRDPDVSAAAVTSYGAFVAKLRAAGASPIDLAPALRSEANALDHVTLSSTDDHHYTDAGATAIARALADALQRSHA